MKEGSSLYRQIVFNLFLLLGAVSVIPASYAQIGDTQADHTQHEATEPVAGSPAAMNMQAMNCENTDRENIDPECMDHENMSMEMGMNMEQEVEAGVGRSPHAYSGGFERERGPYALPASDQVHLADEQSFSRLLFNRLESLDKQHRDAARFDVQVWYGPTYDHAVLKTEGEVHGGSIVEARSELLWSTAISRFWDSQFGVRVDHGEGPSRSWLAGGVQGLAPYWFDIHATAFLGENGRSALSFEAEYEFKLTQRMIIKPRIDMNFYGKDDKERGIGSGLSSGAVGIRFQYQIDRQFAPYFGVEREARFGETADIARRSLGETVRETRWMAGIRIWY